MRSTRGLATVALFTLVGCQFQGSCGSGKTLRMDKAREFITTTLERELGAKPTHVSCPESVTIAKGATFECTAGLAGTTAKLTLVQEDDEGYVTIKSISGILVSTTLEKSIADELGKKLNAHFAVDCGPRVRPSTPGDRFNCKATDAAGRGGAVAVDVKDRDGNVHFEVVPDAPADAPAEAPAGTPAEPPAEAPAEPPAAPTP